MCRVCVHTCMLAQLGSPGQTQPSCLVVSVLCRHMACFYSLCFSLSFFIPFSSSSHSVIKQNKLSSLSSARRLVVFTSYPSTVCHLRWDFSSKGWRASPARGGSDGPWLPARHCPSRPDGICFLFAMTLLTALITLLACLCCLVFQMHRLLPACSPPHRFPCLRWKWMHVHKE